MGEEIQEMQDLLKEVVEHLRRGQRSDRRIAKEKLRRIASLATTMAHILEASHGR